MTAQKAKATPGVDEDRQAMATHRLTQALVLKKSLDGLESEARALGFDFVSHMIGVAGVELARALRAGARPSELAHAWSLLADQDVKRSLN